MTDMSEEQLEEVLQQSSEHLDRARQLTTSMSEENARKKALLDKIRAQRAETLALLTTATTTSDREKDEEDTLPARNKEDHSR
jgi:signal transduction histidine kinase